MFLHIFSCKYYHPFVPLLKLSKTNRCNEQNIATRVQQQSDCVHIYLPQEVIQHTVQQTNCHKNGFNDS